MNSGPDPAENLAAAEVCVREAVAQDASLVALPEMCLQRGAAPGGAAVLPALSADQVAIAPFMEIAAVSGAMILLGSVLEDSGVPGTPYNTSVLIGPTGVIASYRKVHLFDIDAGEGATDKESDRYSAGDRAVVADTPIGGRLCKLGLTICYDLRFPELYRRLALDGAQLTCVPANFTKKTGSAHWATLLRARAIENGMFIVAPAQCNSPGTDGPGSFEAYGHSLVVDPWGRVLLEMDDQPGVGYCEIDLDEVQRVRASIPVLKHRRPEVYGL